MRFAYLSKLAAICAMVFSTLSWGAEESPMSFKVRSETSVLIPSAASTCQEEAEPSMPATQSLEKSYFRFEAPEIEFDAAKIKKNAVITLIKINITIDSDHVGGKYSCVIAGDELKYLYYNGTEYWNPANITYDATSNKFKSSSYWTTNRGYKSCALKCGGVMAHETSFTAPVTFEAHAVSTTLNADGNMTSKFYKATTTGTVRNLF